MDEMMDRIMNKMDSRIAAFTVVSVVFIIACVGLYVLIP